MSGVIGVARQGGREGDVIPSDAAITTASSWVWAPSLAMTLFTCPRTSRASVVRDGSGRLVRVFGTIEELDELGAMASDLR